MPDHIKKQLLKEIQILEHELAHELPAEIKKAASLGDLSENAEYHMAKQRQVFVNARLGQLKRRMAELSDRTTNCPPRSRRQRRWAIYLKTPSTTWQSNARSSSTRASAN